MFFITNEQMINKAFGVKLITSSYMNNAVKSWDRISSGMPPWLDPDDEVITVNMAKHICDYRARLITQEISVAVAGSETANTRASYLQNEADRLIIKLPEKVADAARLGGMIIRYNGKAWDFALPGDFGITAVDNDNQITGCILAQYKTIGDNKYVRLEYNNYENNGEYTVINKAFKCHTALAANANVTLEKEVPLTTVSSWEHISPEVHITNIKQPLFAYFRFPGVNTVDSNSPLGVSVFSNALSELEAVDIAISRKNTEIEDSKHITFIDQTAQQFANNRKIKLPRFIKSLGNDINKPTAVTEHTPALLTDARIKDINFDLSLAGVKCGFSEGVFVLDGQTGMITATQVEADDRDTIQTIKSDRDALKKAIDTAIYGADVMASLYDLAPLGEYEVTYNFGDITYNYEEDKTRWYNYIISGLMPKWLYFVKFEGMSEDEAKAYIEEANGNEYSQGIFES